MSYTFPGKVMIDCHYVYLIPHSIQETNSQYLVSSLPLIVSSHLLDPQFSLKLSSLLINYFQVLSLPIPIKTLD